MERLIQMGIIQWVITMADCERVDMAPIDEFRRKKRNQVLRAVVLVFSFLVMTIIFGKSLSANFIMSVFATLIVIVVFDIFYTSFSMKCPRCKSRVRSYVDRGTGIAYPHLLAETCSKCDLDFRVASQNH